MVFDDVPILEAPRGSEIERRVDMQDIWKFEIFVYVKFIIF